MFAGRPIIGIVGGIGAGKSHVARLFAENGCRVIDSDELVRVAYTHPAVKRAVAKEFGADVLDERGNVERPALARIVFDKPAKRHFLEKLLHPVVNKARVELMDEAARSDATRGYVWDSPLLMETGLDRLCDTVVFVDAPDADRDARTAERGWAEGERARREKAQLPLDKKRSRADHVVANGSDALATSETVGSVLQAIVDKVGSEASCCGGGCGSGGCQVDGCGDGFGSRGTNNGSADVSDDGTTDLQAPAASCGCGGKPA